MMNRLVLTVFVGALATSVVIASPLAQSPAPRALLAKLDAEVPALLEKYQEPGIAVAFMEGCQSSVRAYGLARRDPPAPVRADTVFNLGSISKTFTAWTVMTLVEAGRIQLDDPVESHLKRWRLPESSFDSKAVTIRRLLTHTAGISLPSVSGVDRGAALPSLVDDLSGRNPNKVRAEIIKAPGGAFEYSGGGYQVLQLLIEDVTGESFAAYAKRVIFTPLGMTSTSFGWTSEIVERAATPYSADGNPLVLREFSASGAAGLVSTAEDMASFLRAHCAANVTGVKTSVLHPDTLEKMRSGGVPATALGRGATYSLGYAIFPGPKPEYDIAAHNGSNPGWKAELAVMPAQGVGIVILTNAGDGKARNDVMRMFREEIRSRIRP